MRRTSAPPAICVRSAHARTVQDSPHLLLPARRRREHFAPYLGFVLGQLSVPVHGRAAELSAFRCGAADRKQRTMKFYKSMLQRHMYATGKKYFVAKNPAFSPKIATLLELFPDARIIYLARNPLDMLPSTVSWINYARRVF